MAITLTAGGTVMFTGDSISSFVRRPGEDRAAYPLQVAGRWCFEHPDRPLTWLNTACPGDTVTDLEARWQTDVLDARPDVLSVLVGINDVGRRTILPEAPVISTEEYADTYDRLLKPLADTRLILVEPFLLHVSAVVEAGPHGMLIGDQEREEWRVDLESKIEVVHELAARYDAELLEADRIFTALATPEHWSEDGVHLTAAGHSVLAEAWLELVG
ncbi:MAG: hypothetical protein QOF58_8291 [Pseudonocardiales bacterium]|nr:hypothetical protein [Pseudonocardiales bacterium]